MIGSGNQGKLAEYREILAGLPVELIGPAELSPVPPEPAEDADTFAENAVAKALGYARASGLPAIADDSGLEVAALRGAPGVRSRRYFGDEATAAERNLRLLAMVEGVADRAARFVCVAVLAFPDGRSETFEGEVRGTLATAPRGEHGFGYAPIFIVEAGPRTMAELTSSEKNAVSHRGRAGALLRKRLATLL